MNVRIHVTFRPSLRTLWLRPIHRTFRKKGIEDFAEVTALYNLIADTKGVTDVEVEVDFDASEDDYVAGYLALDHPDWSAPDADDA